MHDARKIAIIDDDAELRQSLNLLLKSNGFESHPYGSAQGFLDCSDPESFDCVVTDVRMRDMSGVELLVAMKRAALSVPVLVMTAYADVPLALKIMREGAVDLLEKPFNDATLLSAVQKALSQGAGQRARESEIRAIRNRLETLTPREKDVLKGLLAGHLNKVIAHDLGIGVRTVETHRAVVMEKMQAENIAELLRMSLIVELDRH